MIFIPGNTASSKNSKINTSKGSFMSKTAKKYLRSLGIQSFSSSRKEVKLYKTIPLSFPVEELKNELKDASLPMFIGMHFVRGTRHKADFGNLQQLIADLMTAFDIIEDDNMDYFYAVPMLIEGEWYSYNKENPGVYIKLVNNEYIKENR